MRCFFKQAKWHGSSTSRPGRCALQRAGLHPQRRAVRSAHRGGHVGVDMHTLLRARSRRALRARSLALRFACPDVGVEGGGVRRSAAAEEGTGASKAKAPASSARATSASSAHLRSASHLSTTT